MWPLSHLLNFPSPYCQCSVIVFTPAFDFSVVFCVSNFKVVLQYSQILASCVHVKPRLECLLFWALFMTLQASLLIPSYIRLKFTLDQSMDGILLLLSIAFFTSFFGSLNSSLYFVPFGICILKAWLLNIFSILKISSRRMASVLLSDI